MYWILLMTMVSHTETNGLVSRDDMFILQALAVAIITYVLLEELILKILYSDLLMKSRLKIVQSYSPVHKTNKKEQNKKKKSFSINTPEELKLMLYNAGVNLRADEFIKIWVGLTVFPPLLSLVFGKGIIPAIFLFLIGAIAPVMYLKIQVKKRVNLFNDQLGDALLIISNSLKAGFTFEQAMSSIAKDLPDPIGIEFTHIIREVDLGEKMEVAMKHVADKMNSKEMELLNTAVSIQRQVGGNLSHVIDNIASTIQERIKLRKKIKTLSAQGEMSGKVIALLPFVVLIMFSILNPDYMEPMYTTPFGYALLGASAFLELTGFLMIKKITKVEM